MSLFSSRLQTLRQSKAEVCLDFLPQELSMLEVVQAIFIFIGRQLPFLFGLANDFHIGQSNDGQAMYELPELRLTMPFRISNANMKAHAVAVKASSVAASLGSTPQVCLLLSALIEPAMLLLLAHYRSPIRPLGAVNVRNRFELPDTRYADSEALLKLKDAEVRAKMLPRARRVKRGLEIDLEVVIVIDENGMTRPVFRQVFTMLQFMKVQGGPETSKRRTEGPNDMTPLEGADTVAFNMEASEPLQWAGICKDYNPIHTSTIVAKLLGFPCIIAHGNHALAIAIACLLADKGQLLERRSQQFVMEVQFKRPIPLPTVLNAQISNVGGDEGGVTVLRLIKGGKVCINAILGADIK